MSHSRRKLALFLVGLFIVSLCLPATYASDPGVPTSSHAFLPGWEQSIGGSLNPSSESVDNGLEFTNHDVDAEGNIYYVQSEDYANWLNGSYSPSQRGFHILKISPSGELESSEIIQCSNYCTNPDYVYSKVVGIHVINEDRFFLVLSIYNDYLYFGNSQHQASSHSLVTAFYDNGTWAWVDVEQISNGYAYSSIIYQEVDEQDNLYVVTREQASGSMQEYTIASYSPSGTNWVRSMEVPYQSPTYNYLTPMFDTDSTGLHAFVTTMGQMFYDSQSISCPSGGESGYCHVWLIIGVNGAKASSVGVPYTSITFREMIVGNGSLHAIGHTADRVAGSNTESNFTGQKISHSPRSAHYYARLDANGSWDAHVAFNEVESSGLYTYTQLVDVLEDNSVILKALLTQQVSLEGVSLNLYPSSDYSTTVLRYEPTRGVIWHNGIGFIDSNDISNNRLRSDGRTITHEVTHSSGGTVSYEYQGSTTGLPVGQYNNEILWFDSETGQVVDVESTMYQLSVAGRGPTGEVLAHTNGWMQLFMPDFDADNVGSDDNCPEVYNPTQVDYNSDGNGDACDDDDDSDGILDVSDSCPLGVLNWLSEDATDHDGDGCKDSDEEDLDDDNDGIGDLDDACQRGITGAGNDLDGDGCKDVEDDDNDGDNVHDESDLCASGEVDWSSGTLTDHDADGCQDDHNEDLDDDNDGIADSMDSCPRGATNWPSNLNTDFDGDGCKDGFEDEDDDGDGIANPIDDCPQSVGQVNTNGCSATQALDGDGGTSTVYYVCSTGGLVVLDPADCPVTENNQSSEGGSDSDNNTFYYVCPGGSDVVTDLSQCEGNIVDGGTTLTLVIDPSSNSTGDYITCDGGRAIVLDEADCPSNSSQQSDSASSGSSSSDSSLMMLFMGGTFAMSAIAMVVVLVRRPGSAPTFLPLDSTEHMFSSPPAVEKKTTPSLTPPPRTTATLESPSAPSRDLIGVSHQGQEWLEWPEGSNQHWFRDLGFGGEWTRYEEQ